MESTRRTSEQPKKMPSLTAAQRSITYLRKLGYIGLATLFTGAAITETAFQKSTRTITTKQLGRTSSDAPSPDNKAVLPNESLASLQKISRTLTVNGETIHVDCVYHGTKIIMYCEDTELELHLSKNTYVPVVHSNAVTSITKEKVRDESVDTSSSETYTEELKQPGIHTSEFFTASWLRDRVNFIVQEVQAYGTEMAVSTITANPDLIEQCPDTLNLIADIGAAKVVIASEYLEQFLEELRFHKQASSELITFSIPITIEIHNSTGGHTMYNCQLNAAGSTKPNLVAYDSLQLIADTMH